MSVQFSLEASRDLEEIKDYISQDNPDAAVRLILLIREKCGLLSQQPGIGRDRSDVLSGLRGFPVGNYVIFYQPTNDGIAVVRVLHGARDIPELFD
ncbi:MAG TPA: type II toxin-antitoxin system RelE/ParE family toxin [Verrucomicrobiae bacterium]|jgi:toxin ParE1/3/4